MTVRTLPEGWTLGTLDDLVTVNPESWDPREGGTIQYLDIAAVTGTGRLAPPKTVMAEQAPSRARRRAQDGDVLVSTVRPYLRAFARVTAAPANLVVSTGFAVLRPKSPEGSEFVYQHVLADRFVQHLMPRMTGSNYPAVRPEDVSQYPIFIPLRNERAYIGRILGSIDEAIERTEDVIAATDALRRALLQDMLTHGVPGWHKEWKHVPGIGTIPADWEVVRLGELLEAIEAGHSPFCHSRPALPHEWGVLKVSSVSWGTFKSEENKALLDETLADPRIEVMSGDLLLSRANTPDLVGRAVLVRNTRPRLLLSDKTLRLRPNLGRVCASFLFTSLHSTPVRLQVSSAATGSSRSMFNISQEALRQVRIALPSLPEQREIIELSELLTTAVAGEKETTEKLRVLKASLSEALLSGRVRVAAGMEAAS